MNSMSVEANSSGGVGLRVMARSLNHYLLRMEDLGLERRLGFRIGEVWVCGPHHDKGRDSYRGKAVLGVVLGRGRDLLEGGESARFLTATIAGG